MLLSQGLPFTDLSGGVFSLGPLCEGAPPAGGGGENLAIIRHILGYGKVLSLRPCGATSLAEGGKGLFFYTFHNLLPKNFYKKSEKTV